MGVRGVVDVGESYGSWLGLVSCIYGLAVSSSTTHRLLVALLSVYPSAHPCVRASSPSRGACRLLAECPSRAIRRAKPWRRSGVSRVPESESRNCVSHSYSQPPHLSSLRVFYTVICLMTPKVWSAIAP